MSNPFESVPAYGNLMDHSDKKARVSLGGDSGEMSEDDDEMDDDDEEDSRAGGAATGSRGKGSGKAGKGGRPKVKLTRGSR